jgi:hypothetical protein
MSAASPKQRSQRLHFVEPLSLFVHNGNCLASLLVELSCSLPSHLFRMAIGGIKTCTYKVYIKPICNCTRWCDSKSALETVMFRVGFRLLLKQWFSYKQLSIDNN